MLKRGIVRMSDWGKPLRFDDDDDEVDAEEGTNPPTLPRNDAVNIPPPLSPTASVPNSPGALAPVNPTTKEPRNRRDKNMTKERPMPIAASRPSYHNPPVDLVTATEAAARMKRFEDALNRVWKDHLAVLGHGDPRVDHACRKQAAAYLLRNEPEVLAALNMEVHRTAAEKADDFGEQLANREAERQCLRESQVYARAKQLFDEQLAAMAPADQKPNSLRVQDWDGRPAIQRMTAQQRVDLWNKCEKQARKEV